MIIEGNLNPSHIVRLFIEAEYAFSIHYASGVEARVTHHKGTWFYAHLKDEKVDQYFLYTDSGEVISPNSLLQRMVETIHQENIATYLKAGKTNTWRELPAIVLQKALEIASGRFTDVTSIMSHQPGRNASIDEITGEFSFSPRTEEFSK